MGIQIVHNQPHLSRIRITLIQHLLDLRRPIFSGAMFCDGYMPFTSERFDLHKDFRHAVSDIFIVNALRRLLSDEHFATLLRAEAIQSMPLPLAERLGMTGAR